MTKPKAPKTPKPEEPTTRDLTADAVNQKIAQLDAEDKARLESIRDGLDKMSRQSATEGQKTEVIEQIEDVLATTPLTVQEIAQFSGRSDNSIYQAARRIGKKLTKKQALTPEEDSGHHEYVANYRTQKTTDKQVAENAVKTIEEAQRVGCWLIEIYGPIAQLAETELTQLVSDAVDFFIMHRHQYETEIEEMAEQMAALLRRVGELQTAAEPALAFKQKLQEISSVAQLKLILEASGIKITDQTLRESLNMINEV